MDSIIFDVDGTLWDSREQVAASWNLAVKQEFSYDRGLTAEMMTPLFGKTMDKIMDALFPDFSEEEKQKITEACFDYENRYLMETPGRYYEGIEETLTELAKEYPLFIVSNCQSGYIETLLHHLKNADAISDFLCYGDTGRQKEETIRMLMEKYDLKAPVYIGDTKGDAIASQKAGIPVIFASYGLGTMEKEDYIAKIDSLPELVTLLAGKKNLEMTL